MNKIIITALLLYTGLITAGCEKTYSVEELEKCLTSGDFNSKNGKNVEQAEFETRKKWGTLALQMTINKNLKKTGQ
ncbi:Uncharacterised protein [Candidatus Bartonella washoeensis]|uniref:Lipoprotein n=1 Tax=Candidatus Bartonella washoeensis Sb944nv TaxID=1094563 RepID=J1J563_9HYPH|nr:hypothetical protein [Bartonella washoeensis]EJF78855.1 hypothetical protein MCQ_01234 [Bartonella washoeensis Sb944nv]SPU27891.1 Uncharacterised protein [Bartonella washoeensis]